MKNTAAIALLVARAAAQDRPDMAMDRNLKDDTQKFQAAAQEDRCKDAGVDTADAALAIAVAAVATEDLKIVTTGKAIATALADQSTKTIALAKADVDNKAKVDADISKDKLELAARRAWDAKKALEVAAIVADTAQQKVVDSTTAADDAAKAILGDATSGATRAVTDATAHVTDETTLETAALATLNLAMTNWKGRATATASSTTVVDAGRTGGAGTAAFVANKPSALLATALTNLTTAVGKCTPATGAWAAQTADIKANCTGGTATGLVKYALRKKLGVDKLATSKASRETYLDAYCRAAQQVGAPDADIKDGKAYWSRANPGVRLDFIFTANVSSDNHADRKNNTLYLTTWTFETLGAVQTAVKVNDSAINANNLALMASSADNLALWLVMKCADANIASGGVITTTGNAGRIYGTTSGITSATGSATDALATAVTAAQTIKNDVTSAKLEGTFRTWKTAATTAMTAYDTMISTDTTFTTMDTSKCNTAAVIKTIALATEAEVVKAENTNGTATKAKRPSNLIVAVSAAATDASTTHIADLKTQCKKLPSMGLYVVTEDATMKPLNFKEVCQGIEYQTVVNSTGNANTSRASFIAAASFLSKAPYNAGANAYITLANGAAVAGFTCQKRKNENGHTWRQTKANDATNFPVNAQAATDESVTGGVYKPTTTAGSKYLLFTAQIVAWVTSRKAMYAKYSDYLVLKEVVTATGKAFRKERDTVLRNAARLTGVKGTDNTNGNLTDLYETEWRKVYGAKQSEIPVVGADMSATTYTHMAPKTLVHPLGSDAGTYALWVKATATEAAAKKAWDDAKVLYDAQKAARIRQEAVKSKATAELAAIKTVQGPAGSATVATGTGALKLAATNAKVITAKAVVDANKKQTDEKALYDTAVSNSNTAKADALTISAYKAIKTARDLVDTAVAATVKAIGDDKSARGILAGKLTTKVAKDVLVAAALTKCKNTKYDAYKATLSTAVADRNKKLASIKTLLETKDKAKVAAGATGARCNKGLTQGNGAARGAKPCTAETDCCGAAKGPVLAATAAGYWKDAPTMTIETCQPKANKTYKYAPPRAPMQDTDPAAAANASTQQDWPFVCIGGASKLAAAASALATAAYMMA